MPVCRLLLAMTLTLALAGCYALRRPDGGGMAEFVPPRKFDPADVALPPGYRIELVAQGLTFPTGVTFDDRGGIYVTEAGYSYGEAFLTPRLVRIEPDGRAATVAEGNDNGPWTGAIWHDGAFYVAEGGVLHGGRILRVDGEGRIEALVEGLPSRGDHHTNGVVVGPDGALYFAVGTATNSGIVGPDNADFGWLHRYPDFHDTPCEDVRLTGASFPSPDPLTGGTGAMALTGAYLPFGTPASPGQVIPGRLPCNGAVFRMPLDGGSLDLVAWGLRNPFGLAFASDGGLYATENAYDRRGSRPVFGAGDLLWRIEQGAWYGWPDYHGGATLDAGDRYVGPGERGPPARLLAETPSPPPRPVARFAVHSSSNGLDFARDGGFGHSGHAFVAQFGDQTPTVGKVLGPVGYRVVRVDPRTGIVTPFAVNRTPGPASYTGGGGLERPLSVRFDPLGSALYVVDFGVLSMSGRGSKPWPETGALWRIVRSNSPSAATPAGGREAMP
jgi:glucose/arabinose dehydrogenase